ncbi:hypothetical protein [Streptomyces cylindrosporus]|uniref:Uncharacterized protein n=1 Tax=Streptomyces cylindrosporus TaxID=2927583 RepID=A0ABS9Y1F9_9ACTN|nr:hypothetical protein [Streptomyces cylindrosporus]MCI3271053.1 hypothetical protein [Streptomyces cylindrosporus]
MSDLEAWGNPEHQCDDRCAPYEPLSDRDLETLDESTHIDTLYEDLNLVREHAALLFLAMNQRVPDFRVPVRSLAVLLDISESEAECLLGPEHQRVGDIVQHAVNVAGEDGYVGLAMAAVFRAELMEVSTTQDEDGPSE